ncbi:transglycosylase SLT domain-containing protein [Mycolicibacterium aubagnense]|nr:transglycosylase SLT domain-containing protein [Mycolicibacterium aubagnense]
MSLHALVAEAGQALNAARGLFGPAPQGPVWSSTSGLAQGRQGVTDVGQLASQSWLGAGGKQFVASNAAQAAGLDAITDADGATAPGMPAGAKAAGAGGAGMDGVIDNTRSGVAAIAPSTGTPAGKVELVNHLQGQLDRAKALLKASQQRSVELSALLRRGAGGYGMGGGRPGAMGGMPMGMPGGGIGMPSLGGMTRPDLSALTSLMRPRKGERPEPRSGLTMHEPLPSGPGPERVRAAIRNALTAKGITDPAARARWEAGMMTVVSRESNFNPNAVNRSDSNAQRGDPSSGSFQFTGATFRAHHEPGTSNDPRDEQAAAAAFINYARSRYGVAWDGSNLARNIQQADPTRPPHGY